MRTHSLWIVSLFAIILAGVVGGAVVGSSGTGYGLHVSEAVDTEPRTVTLEGTDYEVSAVASVDQSDTLSVDVSAPDDKEVYVDLYNNDRQVEASRSGSEQVHFDLNEIGELRPGSYLFGLYDDGNYQTIHPVVIEGYEVDTDHQTTVSDSDSVTVEITVTETESDQPPETVELVRHADGNSDRVTASATGDGTYQATLAPETLETGDHKLYAIAFGPEVDGTQEPLALSATSTVTVESDPDDGSEPSTDTATPTETPPLNETASPTASPPSTPTASPTETSTDSPTPTAPPTETSTPSPTQTDDTTIITPATHDDETPTTVEGGESGLILLALISIGFVIAHFRVRHRTSSN